MLPLFYESAGFIDVRAQSVVLRGGRELVHCIMRRKSQARHFNSVETLEYSALQNKHKIQRRHNFQIIFEIMASEIKHLNFRAKESIFFPFCRILPDSISEVHP